MICPEETVQDRRVRDPAPAEDADHAAAALVKVKVKVKDRDRDARVAPVLGRAEIACARNAAKSCRTSGVCPATRFVVITAT